MKILTFISLSLLIAFGVASHFQLENKRRFVNCLELLNLSKCTLIFKE
jgi:hypothetical protein